MGESGQSVHIGDYDEDVAYRIVNDIYSSAILRDTIQRHGIRNIELLERVVKYVFDNIGNSFSAKKVADYFKSQQRKVDLNTVYNYLSALESAYIIRKIPRYDIKDNYPKYVVTMDDFWSDNVEGVKHKHLAEFLLMDEY